MFEKVKKLAFANNNSVVSKKHFSKKEFKLLFKFVFLLTFFLRTLAFANNNSVVSVLTYYKIDKMEKWLSGLRQQLAKLSHNFICGMGSNPFFSDLSGHGGIGRHIRFRTWWPWPCRFKSYCP